MPDFTVNTKAASDASIFAPLFNSPIVDRLADQLVHLPGRVLGPTTPGVGSPTNVTPYTQTHAVGGGRLVTAPVVLPMWAADP